MRELSADSWEDFHEVTGIDGKTKFAGKYPYGELLPYLRPTLIGTYLDLVVDAGGARVGLVAGRLGGYVLWDARDTPPRYKHPARILRLIKTLLPRRGGIGMGRAYRWHSEIVWSADLEDLSFAQAVKINLPWKEVDRTRTRAPFGVIHVALSPPNDNGHRTYQPTNWTYRGTGRWTPNHLLEKADGKARGRVAEQPIS